MTARKRTGAGAGSDVSYAGGRAGQRVKQFAIERGIDVPSPARKAAKKSARKKAAAKAKPPASRNKGR
jgi:putative NADH-flavin reductase